MAIDTQDKRRSTVAVLPVANSGINVGDRVQVTWNYRGLVTSVTMAVQGRRYTPNAENRTYTPTAENRTYKPEVS